MNLTQLRIGILSGGSSSERAVSVRSGQAVFKGLLQNGFKLCRIDPRNKVRAQRALSEIDLAFIALHGKGGEDGTIQRRLERLKIPYVGSDALGSHRAFNKVESKKIFERNRIPTPRWRVVNRRTWRELEAFPAPFFVKPVADGSSIGVFLVEDFRSSAEKIMQALKQYSVLLIEKQIVGRELTVGILGKWALPIVELRPKRKFYDYQAKYTRGMTEYLVPAPIPDSWRRKFHKLALKVHRVLGLRDFSRIDLMVDQRGQGYILEANTIPGFTELSLLPKAAREAGISFENLCRRLVQMAWQRAGRNGKT